MKIESSEIIKRPLNEVYNLVRNDLVKVVPYLPNVDRIEVKDKTEDNGKLSVTNHWYAKVELPSMMTKFLKPEILSWKDMANWDDASHTVNYKMESFLANDLFDAKGTNVFVAVDENTTELKLKFELTIYPEKVPGVPRLLAGKVKPMIEGLIEKMITPNLTSLGKGINQYFQNQ